MNHGLIFRRILLRTALFLFPASALLPVALLPVALLPVALLPVALLPVAAPRFWHPGAGGYGVVLGAIGFGALLGAVVADPLCRRESDNVLPARGVLERI